MRNFSSKTKANSRREYSVRRALAYGGLALCIVGVIVLGKNAFAFAVRVVAFPVYAVERYFEHSSATIPVFVRSREELLETINSLNAEIATHDGMRETVRLLTEENTELRTLLSASSTPRIVAGVIARPPFTPYDTIVLDRGSDDGIVEHAPVFYGSNNALGYVRATFPHNALVTLFSSPNVETTVFIFGPNIFTTAYGEGGGVIRVSVPQGVQLSTENMVILPSLDTGILGTFDDIQSIPTEPEQHGYITFDTPMQSLRTVAVGAAPITPASFDAARAEVHDAEKTLFTIPVPEGVSFITGSTTASSTEVYTPRLSTTTP